MNKSSWSNDKPIAYSLNKRLAKYQLIITNLLSTGISLLHIHTIETIFSSFQIICTQECSCRYSKISYEKKIYNYFFWTDIKNITLEFITFLHQKMHVFTLPNRYEYV